MPKSKRSRVVHLTKTKSRVQERKSKLVEDVQANIEQYSIIYLFECVDMRTQHMKAIRSKFSNSRFFMGRNKVMRIALGRDPEEAYRQNLDKMGSQLSGNVGLLFTNRPINEIESFFKSYSVPDFARAGFSASKSITLTKGALPGNLPSSMFEQLLALGMPVELDVGVIKLRQDFRICTKGETLTPEQAQLLKLFGFQLAEFQIRLLFRWREGEFTKLAERKVKLMNPNKASNSNQTSKSKKKEDKKEFNSKDQVNDESDEEIDMSEDSDDFDDVEEDDEESDA